jgi:SAM-dependent methyltransferase
MAPEVYLQRDQPPGVPPLELTGERTLPDVPEENYWYQRHLVVYQWIAQRVGGLHVVDVASGEGYGAAELARSARSVLGIEPNPDAYEHARLKYGSDRLTFRRDIAETFIEPCDAVVFLQTIEHVQDPDAVLEHFRSQLNPGGVAYVSTPNVLTLAPEGAERSGNPWHIKEYRPEEFRALCEAHFSSVELIGLFHARKLRVHQVAIERAGWDAIHRRLGITKRFYDWFVPAIEVRDFALRPGPPAPLERALDFLAVCRP